LAFFERKSSDIKWKVNNRDRAVWSSRERRKEDIIKAVNNIEEHSISNEEV
jgi:hypothetical protein